MHRPDPVGEAARWSLALLQRPARTRPNRPSRRTDRAQHADERRARGRMAAALRRHDDRRVARLQAGDGPRRMAGRRRRADADRRRRRSDHDRSVRQLRARDQWLIADGGNSGIMFRVSEAADATHLTGPEMQVLDNAAPPRRPKPAELGRRLLRALRPVAGRHPAARRLERGPPRRQRRARRALAERREDRRVRDRKPRLAGEARTSAPTATSPATPANRAATSRSRTTAIAWPIAGSRSGRCRSIVTADGQAR